MPYREPVHGSSFTTDFATVLAVAAITSLISRLLRQPSVLGYLAAGLIVGPYVPIPVFADPHRVEALSEFGVVLVMFAVGLEFRLAQLLRVLPTSGLVGLMQVLGLTGLGFLVGRGLGFDREAALFLGASLGIASTMVVSNLYATVKVDPEVRELVFGTLVVQDVLAIVLVATMTAVAAGTGLSAAALASTVGRLAAVLTGMMSIGLLVVPRLVRLTQRMDDPATSSVVATGIAFATAILARELGYSVALGAFIAGMLVAESGAGSTLEHQLRSMKDVFAAVFFVSVGMSVDPSLAVEHAGTSLLLAAVVVVGQFVLTTLAGVLSGNGLRRSVIAGASFGQVGEFAFILVGIGRAAGLVPRSMPPILVTVAVITAFTTPLALRSSERLVRRLDRLLPARLSTSLSLYEAWLERIRREAGTRESRSRTRLVLGAILLDAAMLVGLFAATVVFGDDLRSFVGRMMPLRASAQQDVVVGVASLLATPLTVGLLRSTRALGDAVAARSWPKGASSSSADSAARLVGLGVQSMALLGVLLPASLVLAPMVGGTPILLVGGVAILVAFVALYRAAGAVDRDVRSGLATMIALLATTDGAPVTPDPSPAAQLPGLGATHTFVLQEGAASVGRTLASLDLRARTGATVVALVRGDSTVLVPTGREALSVGDGLVLAGTKASVRDAQRLLDDRVG